MQEKQEKSIISPIQPADLKNGVLKTVSKKLLDRILFETGGKSVVVIVLPDPFITNESQIRGFHISVANTEISLIPRIFLKIAEVLLGKGKGVIIKNDL
mgnify:FL=1